MAVEPHEFEAHGGGTGRAERQELQAKPDIRITKKHAAGKR